MQQGLQWPPPRLSLSHSVVTEVCHLCHHHYYLLTKVPSASWHSQVQPREPDVANLSREGIYSKVSMAPRIPRRQEPGPGPPRQEQCPKVGRQAVRGDSAEVLDTSCSLRPPRCSRTWATGLPQPCHHCHPAARPRRAARKGASQTIAESGPT